MTAPARDDLATMQRLERYIAARLKARFGGQQLDDGAKAAVQRELETIWFEVQFSTLDVSISPTDKNRIDVFWPEIQPWPHGLPSNETINKYLDDREAT
jgi:hypothetical protein